jgi:hypothetical protein
MSKLSWEISAKASGQAISSNFFKKATIP